MLLAPRKMEFRERRSEHRPTRRSADWAEPGAQAALNRRSARSQDFIAVVHSESAHRETTKTQFLALIVLSREVHGSARKVRSPIDGAF